ncbi:fibronectin type III domain-containing protein [uncultured Kordia sp.]|uniref:fibronectin type III domain-containing protein n=1 Tax=uncultured Kordia sp. TaxID=507699 RepID=UPI00260D762A|nr:fibronectin type III domain-containing protein [uncultured Kordia sp.]
MKKIVLLLSIILIYSCSDEEETITNNNITPSAPSLISPNDGSTIITQEVNQEISFEWTVASDPDNDIIGYRWYADTDPNFSNPFHHFSETNSTTAYLTPNQTYYWRVTTRDSNGNISNYSQTWSFYLEDGLYPSAPTLIFPLHETECSNDNLTFQWNASDNPSGNTIEYNLYISDVPDFNQAQYIYTTYDTEYNVTLPQGTALYWIVEATNGNNSSYSEARSLYTQGDGVINTAPQLQYLSPQDGAIVTGNSITLSWIGDDLETNNSDLSYRVYASEIGSSLNLLQEGNSIQYTFNNLQTGTEYQWLIYVTDGDGATNVGDIQTFLVQ